VDCRLPWPPRTLGTVLLAILIPATTPHCCGPFVVLLPALGSLCPGHNLCFPVLLAPPSSLLSKMLIVLVVLVPARPLTLSTLPMAVPNPGLCLHCHVQYHLSRPLSSVGLDELLFFKDAPSLPFLHFAWLRWRVYLSQFLLSHLGSSEPSLSGGPSPRGSS
jgi:hypothetical protein